MTRVKRDCRCPRVKHEHGTPAAYDRCGCRCLACAVARSQWKAAWKAGTEHNYLTVPVHGTQLRLRALTVLGYSPREIAEATGLNDQYVLRIRNIDALSRRVLPQTRDAVADAYDRLWNHPSTGPHARRMRNLAARRGWLPPLALDDDSIDDPAAEPYRERYVHAGERGMDEIAIEEAIRGRRVHLYPDERADAVRRMTERGYSSRDIAERLDVAPRSVVRRRSGVRTAAA